LSICITLAHIILAASVLYLLSWRVKLPTRGVVNIGTFSYTWGYLLAGLLTQ
jgi:hypothetical protein